MKLVFRKLWTGFLFGSGLLIAVSIWGFVIDTYREMSRADNVQVYKAPEEEFKYINAAKVVIQNTRLVDFGEIISVTANIKNTHNLPFDQALATVRLFDDEGTFGQCTRFFERFEKGESRDVVIRCNNFKSKSFPKNAKYELLISQVQQYGIQRVMNIEASTIKASE